MVSSGVTRQTSATAPIAAWNPILRSLAKLVDDLAGLLALLAHIEDEVTGLLDLVVVAALRVAVRAQHVELVRQVRSGEQVARLAVAGDEP